jgi:dTDP-4-dehydrorhamnose 3,5-epimerase
MKASVSVQRSRRRSRWRHRPRCSRPLFPRESILLFEPTTLEGAWLLDIERRGDERGFFSRGWCRRELEARGLVAEFVQNNIVWSARKGTIRGLHFQTAPFQETKLVRCTRGAIWDVIIDLRPGSSTYLEWAAFELTAANRRQIYVPKDFAHGYQTLVDDTEVCYEVSEYYRPEAERGIRWDDPQFAIAWPETASPTVSPKDCAWPDFRRVAAALHTDCVAPGSYDDHR